jgi:hypothetical protein
LERRERRAIGERLVQPPNRFLQSAQRGLLPGPFQEQIRPGSRAAGNPGGKIRDGGLRVAKPCLAARADDQCFRIRRIALEKRLDEFERFRYAAGIAQHARAIEIENGVVGSVSRANVGQGGIELAVPAEKVSPL